MREFVRAQVRLIPPEEGGRATGIVANEPVSSYAPHARVGAGGELPVLVVDGPAWMLPGEEAELVLELRYPGRVDYSALVEGEEFVLLEGARVVARGTVLRHRREA